MLEQNGDSLGTEDAGNQTRPEDLVKWEFARSVLKTAITELGIKDIAEYNGEPLSLRWHLFFNEFPNDIILNMLVQGLFGTIHADMSLILASNGLSTKLNES